MKHSHILENVGMLLLRLGKSRLGAKDKTDEEDDAEDGEKANSVEREFDRFGFFTVEVPHHGSTEDGESHYSGGDNKES